MIGLKRNTVRLCEHDKMWEIQAQQTINILKNVLGDIVIDIQHVGSTSIYSIKAKPIIDIAVAVDDFNNVLSHESQLKQKGIYYVPQANIDNQLLFACGSYYDKTGDLQSHFIHVVYANSMDWINYINFRDYLNANIEVAREYENLKVKLAKETANDPNRKRYLNGKHDFIVNTLKKALINSYLDKEVNVIVQENMKCHSINYGYVPNIMLDGNEQLGVYLFGFDSDTKDCVAHIIGIAHIENDTDKLIGVAKDTNIKLIDIENKLNLDCEFEFTYSK